jgi:hypothetical protein
VQFEELGNFVDLTLNRIPRRRRDHART